MNGEHMPDEIRLKELLLGKQIVKAEIRDEPADRWEDGPTGFLTLSDGTILKVWGNTGGCSCGAGDYPLTSLNGTDNAITNVRVEEAPDGDFKCPICREYYCDHRGYYRIFVLADDSWMPVASFEGSDGNGYYGTGWWLAVESNPQTPTS